MSDGGCREAVFPNLARHFIPVGPNELWVGHITYIRTRLAFVYLAVILDAWSRRAVGYAADARGAGRPAVSTRLYPPYRPWQSIWLCSLPGGADRVGPTRIDEPAWESVRQCPMRKLHQNG